MLIVVGIIAILMSMSMPLIAMASRTAKRTTTLSILNTTEAAINLFRSDMRVFPHQAVYPDAGPASPFFAGQFVNRLAAQVGTAISIGDAEKVRLDIEAATSAYRYDVVLENTPEQNTGAYFIDWSASQATAGPLAINATNILWETLSGRGNTVHIWGQGDPRLMDGNGKRGANNVPTAMMVNRMFQERARRALLGGYLEVKGTQAFLPPVNGIYPPRTYADCQYDHRLDRVLLWPASADRPGWTIDCIGKDLDPHFRNGDAIVDAWKRPLIYIQQLSPSIPFTPFMLGPGPWNTVTPFDTRWYGMRSRPILPADLPLSPHADHSLDGRIRLSTSDCGWGEATPVDAAYFPTAGKLLDSDVRYYSAPGFEKDFELWSAGPDGKFCWRRSDPSNRDNLAARRYLKGIE